MRRQGHGLGDVNDRGKLCGFFTGQCRGEFGSCVGDGFEVTARTVQFLSTVQGIKGNASLLQGPALLQVAQVHGIEEQVFAGGRGLEIVRGSRNDRGRLQEDQQLGGFPAHAVIRRLPARIKQTHQLLVLGVVQYMPPRQANSKNAHRGEQVISCVADQVISSHSHGESASF